MEIRKVTLIGLGALGVLYAQQLSKYLPKGNLKIVADAERVRRYRRDGVFCNGERCDFEYMTTEEPAEPADLLMIAVKYGGLRDAIAAVKNHVGPETVILSLLNGIDSEEIIGRTYGAAKILLCVSQGMDAVKTGNALTYHNKGLLVFGDREPGMISETTEAVSRFFTRAGIAHEVNRDMKKHQWSKFMLNAGCNPLTAVYQCGYGGLQEEGPIREMMIGAMEEVAAIAAKERVTLTREDISYWLNVIGGLNPQAKPSMQQDVEARHPGEVEMFGGAILELSERHGVPAPINRLLYEKLKAIESAY